MDALTAAGTIAVTSPLPPERHGWVIVVVGCALVGDDVRRAALDGQ